MSPFENREQAGRLLAERLAREKLAPPVVVLALPRGGVPVAAEVARRLGAPLDLLFVRRIGAPWHREYAVAAVVDGKDPQIVVDAASTVAGVDPAYIEREAASELCEIERRREVYLRGRAPVDLAGTTAIVVDDGIATGHTMSAAIKALRKRGAASVIVAVPVAPHSTLILLRSQCDRLICLEEPDPFEAVGLHYTDFHQVSDDEVIEALKALAAEPAAHETSPAQ